MSDLQLTTRFTVHAGKHAEFRSLAARCMEVTRERDTRTLQYEWFSGDGGDVFVIRERYPDSAAVLEHAANLGELLPGIVAVSDPDIEIYGTPSADLMAALSVFSPRVYAPFQSP